MSHSLLLWAKTPNLNFNLAFLKRYAQACASDRWKTRNLIFPNYAEQYVILMLMLPLTSLELLMMSLVMLCAAPGWLKKGLTSQRQSPITFSPSFSSKTNLEGSSGTSTRKTSLTDVPEGAETVLHLAICPSETWQARGASTPGAVKESMRIQRYPLSCGCVWAVCISNYMLTDRHRKTIPQSITLRLGPKSTPHPSRQRNDARSPPSSSCPQRCRLRAHAAKK